MEDFVTVRRDLESVLGKRDLPDGMALGDVLGRLDEAAGAEGLPARLVHYLERRSYVKALDWLGNPEMKHEA